MVNRWYYEELEKKKELDVSEAIKPIMVVSINTLYLYDQLLLKRGITNVIDSFIHENAVYEPSTGQYIMSELADFDEYLRRNPYNKSDDAVTWRKKMIYQQ